MLLNRKKLFKAKYIKKYKEDKRDLINAIFLILNFIWFFFNIFYQFKKEIDAFFGKQKSIIFKNVDFYTINIFF